MRLVVVLSILLCISTYLFRSMVLDNMLTAGAALLAAGFATGVLAAPFIRPVALLVAALNGSSGCYLVAILVRWDTFFYAASSAMVLCLAIAAGAAITLIPAVTRFSWAVARWSATPALLLLASFLRVRVIHLYKKLASLV